MTAIKVLLALPEPECERLRQAIARSGDMVIVGRTTGVLEALIAAGRTRPDVVVIGAGEETPGIVSHLLAEHSDITILSITRDASPATLYSLRPHRTPVADPSPDGLLNAIRSAVNAEGE